MTRVGLAPPDSPEAEAYRRLRANLLARRPEGGAFVIVGPSAGVGTSVVAANLATALAESGRQAIVVDADLRAPEQHTFFGRPLSPGLGDVLAGGDLKAALAGGPSDGLRVLTAGKTSGRPGDVIAGARMADTLAALRKLAGWVIIDAPPLLARSEAVSLAPLSDGVILVLASGVSRRDDALASRAALEAVGSPVVGSVLTGVSLSEAGLRHFGDRDERPASESSPPSKRDTP